MKRSLTRYEEVERYGLKTQDKKYLLKHLEGGKLTPMQTIYAKCYECQNCFADGKLDCGLDSCPNYPYFRFNPHRITVKKKLTDKRRGELRARLKKGLDAKNGGKE